MPRNRRLRIGVKATINGVSSVFKKEIRSLTSIDVKFKVSPKVGTTSSKYLL